MPRQPEEEKPLLDDLGDCRRPPAAEDLAKDELEVYHNQLVAPEDLVDLEWWKDPKPARFPEDPLGFLRVPGQVHQRIMADLSEKLLARQKQLREVGLEVNKAVIITMGGLYPGSMLHDNIGHLSKLGLFEEIEFGTMGVACYRGPGERLKEPLIKLPLNLTSVRDESILVVEDFIDSSFTGEFVGRVLKEAGASRVVIMAPYVREENGIPKNVDEIIAFANFPKQTWVITERERVETLIKRVPFWIREGGADYDRCEEILVDLIGYPRTVVQRHLPLVFRAMEEGRI